MPKTYLYFKLKVLQHIILMLFFASYLYPANYGTVNNKAQSLYNYAKSNKSIKITKETLKSIINKYPQYQNIDKIIYELASIYLLGKEDDKSYEYYSLLLEKNNSKLRGKALYSLAKMLSLKKEYEKARKLINKHIAGLKKDEYFFKLVYLNGEIRFYEGEYKKTISLLTYINDKIKSLKNEEDAIKPRLLLRLGQSHFYEKEQSKAKKYFAEIVKEYPYSLEAKFAKNWMQNLKERTMLYAKDSFFAPFIIQAGAFSQYKNALSLQKRILKLKLKTILISANLYKIIIPVESQRNANLIIKLLKENYIKPIFVKK